MFNTGEFSNFLYDNGATLVGFADLSKLVKDDLRYGVSIALRITPKIVVSIHDGPNRAYFDAYHDLNSRLNVLAKKGAGYLENHGYNAFAQTTDAIKQDEFNRTRMPHKTVAVNAGLGFIGKSALFDEPLQMRLVRARLRPLSLLGKQCPPVPQQNFGTTP